MSNTDNEARFDRIYAAHRNAVTAYCLRRLPRADALDATAEVFAVAWRRIHQLPAGPAELSWLYGVAFRIVSNQRRTRQRQNDLVVRVGMAGDPDEVTPDEQVVQAEEYRLLSQALDDLRPLDREVLLLVTWEEHPRDEIAAILGVSRPALDQRIHRASRRLRKAYDRLARQRTPRLEGNLR